MPNITIITGTGSASYTVSTGARGPAGAAGQGVPTGGSTGQVLKKTSATDYATAWQNDEGGEALTFAGSNPNSSGQSQIVEWRAGAGASSADGNAIFTINSSLLASPVTVSVPVYAGEQRGAGTFCPRAVAALNANSLLANAGMVFALRTVLEYITLTVPAAVNDETLSITSTCAVSASFSVGIRIETQSGDAPGPTATFLGQYCKASSGWWQWDGTAWIQTHTLDGTPVAHKASHATGGADAITPGDIGAATAAQGSKADSALQPAAIGVTVASQGHTHAQLHDRQHAVTSASDHTFPGGTSQFLRADGTFATPPGGTVDNAAVNTAIAANPSATWKKLLNEEAAVVVNSAGTDTQRGTALVAAYAAAKLLTPNGSALSATNRAAVIIPPGKYKLSATLVLDTDFVDLIAQVPTKPSRRLNTDVDSYGYLPDGYDLGHFRPQITLVYSELARLSTIKQMADNVRMLGFSIAQLYLFPDFGEYYTYYSGIPDWGALLIGQGCSNAPSVYQDMYFWSSSMSYVTVGGVRAYDNFSGTWINCVANSASYRLGFGAGGTETAVFSAKMYDCDAGVFSYVGDFPNEASKPNYTCENAHFERCKAIGYSVEAGGSSGENSFAGCNITAAIVKNTCTFIECEAGDRSFGLGATNEGTYIRCRGGAKCFGATSSSNTDVGNFAGYAEDCIAGAGSFGGTDTAGFGKLTGTLVRCTGTGNTASLRAEGSTIRDSRITTTTTGVHGITLLDSNTTISNSDIIVYQGGTGVPIYAATAKNVAAYACRMNNASNDADGLHANVTNLVTTPYNVVSNSVR